MGPTPSRASHPPGAVRVQSWDPSRSGFHLYRHRPPGAHWPRRRGRKVVLVSGAGPISRSPRYIRSLLRRLTVVFASDSGGLTLGGSVYLLPRRPRARFFFSFYLHNNWIVICFARTEGALRFSRGGSSSTLGSGRLFPEASLPVTESPRLGRRGSPPRPSPLGISLAAIAPLPPDPPQVSLPPPAPLHPLGFLVSLVGHHRNPPPSAVDNDGDQTASGTE